MDRSSCHLPSANSAVQTEMNTMRIVSANMVLIVFRFALNNPSAKSYWNRWAGDNPSHIPEIPDE